jgi:hypothetical protein
MRTVMTPAKVCSIAARIAASCRRESVGSDVHQCSENPCHALRERPSLNEKATAMSTGSKDHVR